MSTQFHTLTVAAVRRETPNAVSIVLDVPAGLKETFAYQPGQYLTLRATLGGEDVRRHYSICAGLDDPHLRIAVTEVEGGVFSPFANRVLKAGDQLEVIPPKGRFTLPLAAASPQRRGYLAIATGSGITPVLSIIKTALEREPHAHVLLLYGNRTIADILFKGELDDLKDRFLERLTVLHVLSRERQDFDLLNGRIDAAKIAAVVKPLIDASGIDLAFLCGQTAMLKVARAQLQAIGIAREKIRFEIFYAQDAAKAQTPAPPPDRTDASPAGPIARITLNGRETSVTLRVNETLIEAATRAGLEAPYSCKGGMCCTCRARLTEGEVVMAANYSLEPWEIAAGFILTCQSRAQSATLSVDYDAR